MDEKKQPTPTYISLPKLEKLMELITQRKMDKISASYFQSYGFSPSDSYLAISALRFLSVVDESANATDLASKLHLTGDARKKEIEGAVRKAYEKLFAVTEKPYELGLDELMNEFIHHYGLTIRVAKPAAQAFLRLCEYAGLLAEGIVHAKARSVQGEQSRKEPKKGGRPAAGAGKMKDSQMISTRGDMTQIPILDGSIILSLPSMTLSQAIVSGDLQKVVKELTEFAEKYKKTDGDGV